VTIRQSALEIFIAHHDKHPRENGKVDTNIENGKKVLVELELAEDEDEEEVGDDADQELEEPSPEGHVDVQDVPLLSLPEDVGVKDVDGVVGVLDDVVEG
jgi:hypothetical protein